MSHRSLGPTTGLLALLLTTSAAADQPELAALLAKAGEVEALKSSTGCRFVEQTVVEQLDRKGRSEGRVHRRYETTVKNARVVKRTLLDKQVEGEPSSLMVKDPETNTEVQHGAFHPSQQALYTFELEGPADGPTVKVLFAPRKKNEKHMQGVATLEAATGRILRFEGRPSKLPSMVDAMNFVVEQRSTACGLQTTHLSLEGSGGFLFFTRGFRSETKLVEHERL